jgi:hypothetical protein
VTHEFTSGSLGEALENYELFLRGIGYTFDGQLDVVTEDIVVDESKYEDDDRQISTQVFNQMVGNLLNETKVESIKDPNEKHCSRCGLSKSVMENNMCWDSACPVHGRG